MKRTIAIALAASTALAVDAMAFAQSQNPSLAALLDRFRTTNVSRQLEVGKQIGQVGDVRALHVLEPWLDHQDRALLVMHGVRRT